MAMEQPTPAPMAFFANAATQQPVSFVDQPVVADDLPNVCAIHGRAKVEETLALLADFK